jgi:hypothetical protein
VVNVVVVDGRIVMVVVTDERGDDVVDVILMVVDVGEFVVVVVRGVM